jgi:hypothetical protein
MIGRCSVLVALGAVLVLGGCSQAPRATVTTSPAQAEPSGATPTSGPPSVIGKMPSDESAAPQVTLREGLPFSAAGTIGLDGEITTWGDTSVDGASQEVVYFTVPSSLGGLRAGLTLPVIVSGDSKLMDSTGAPISSATFYDLLGGRGGSTPAFDWHLVFKRDGGGRLMLISAKELEL